MKIWSRVISNEDVAAARKRRALRRADRYTSMAVAGLLQCDGLDVSSLSGPETALITWSRFGPHATVFATLDDILDYPEDLILPTKFSHSVVNAAASYIGAEFGITGPTFALVGFESVEDEAFTLAKTMIKTGACTKALMVGIEETGMLTDAVKTLVPGRFAGEFEDRVDVRILDKGDVEGVDG